MRLGRYMAGPIPFPDDVSEDLVKKGVDVRVAGRAYVLLVAIVLLAACVASETRSIVSRDDISKTKYRQIVVFVEKVKESEQPLAEQIVVAALKDAGIHARTSSELFNASWSEEAKNNLLQSEYDAVLYFTVVQNEIVEERVASAWAAGQTVFFNLIPFLPGVMTFQMPLGSDMYIIKPDSSVYKAVLYLKTRVDLQDTKSAKLVWTSETISSVNSRVSDIRFLFDVAAKQVTRKLRADGVI